MREWILYSDVRYLLMTLCDLWLNELGEGMTERPLFFSVVYLKADIRADTKTKLMLVP